MSTHHHDASTIMHMRYTYAIHALHLPALAIAVAVAEADAHAEPEPECMVQI